VGGYYGTLKHYENTGTPTSFEWTYQGFLKDKNGVDIDVGYTSIPAFVDLGEGSEEPEKPQQTVWHTRIASTSTHHFDFVVMEGGMLELKDMWITNCGNGTQGHRGLTIKAADALITGNLFDNNSIALYIDGGDGSSISYNTFVNNSIGILARDCTGLMILNNSFSDQHSGIHLIGCSNTLITLNDVGRTGTGLIIESCSDINVEKNTIADSARGVHVAGGEKNTIHGNNITGCSEGVVLRDSRENTVTDNNLVRGGVLLHGTSRDELASHFCSNNMVNQQPLYYYVDARDDAVPEDAGSVIMVNCTNMTMENLNLSYTTAGLQLFWVNDSSISDCVLTDSLMGISLTGSCGNVIQQNVIMNNIVGLVVQNGSVGNSIHFNTIKENEEAGLDASGNSGLPVDAVSNYWGGYNGPFNASLNPDGDGDSIAGNVGFRPWLRFPPGENVWYVDATAPSGGDGRPGEPFARIQDAVDNASKGEIIIVLPGVYRENVVLHSPLNIYGVPGDVILDAGGKTGFRILTKATITNFTLTNASTDLELEADATIYNTTFTSVNFTEKSNLSVGYYLDVITLNVEGEPITGVALSIENNISWRKSYLSGAEGRISDIPLIEYIQNSTHTKQLNPYYLNASCSHCYPDIDIDIHYCYANATLDIHSNSEITLNLSRHGAFGTAAVKGDLDGDGVEDYAVGAPFDPEEGWNSGTVFIFFGDPGIIRKELRSEDADLVILGEEQDNGYFGTALVIGDINQDDKNDLIVSAPGFQGGDGAVYLFSGELFEGKGLSIADAELLISEGSGLGTSLITGDVDMDGYPDILAENDIGVTVFYGKSGIIATLQQSSFYGLRHPALVNISKVTTLAAIMDEAVRLLPLTPGNYLLGSYVSREDFIGSFNHTEFNNGLTISPYVPILSNGDFDDGWENWSRGENIRGKNDGQWELTTEEHGDWKAYDGPTASLGPVGHDYVATANNAGRYSNGKLVSEPFQVPIGIKYFDLWHHAKWWSYERANEGNQDEIPDAIILRLVNDSSEEVVAEKVYNQTEYNYDGEVQGRLQFDISEYQGEWLRFEMEHVTNRKEYDDGLIQIDNIAGIKENPDTKGDFTSDFLDLNMSIVYFTPHWDEELNNGNITPQYRTNDSQDWVPMVKDELTEINAASFQYRVVIEATPGEPYPVLKTLHFNFYNFTPEPIGKGIPYNGGQIFGNDTLAIVDDTTAVLYNRTSPAFNITSDQKIDALTSIGDVDGNGISDLLISSNNSVYLIPMNRTSGDLELQKASYSFPGEEGFGLFLHRNLVGSPLEHRWDGRVYLLPTHLNDSAIIGVDMENHSMVYPDSSITLNLSLLNKGLFDMDSLEVTINITGEGDYTYENSTLISIDSWKIAKVKFDWHVPATEGTNYILRFSLPPDDDNSNNFFSLNLRAHYHTLDLSTEKDYDAVRPGGVLGYLLKVENKGTFGPDNVTFETELPLNWDWCTKKDETNITHLVVDDNETIELFVFANSSVLDEYPIVFRAISENGVTNKTLNLTGHIVERDLVPVGVRLYREDGKEAEPVAGEDTRIVLGIRNDGSQDAGTFDVSLDVDGTPHQVRTTDGVQGNTTINLSFTCPFTEGLHILTFVVDPNDTVKEYEEENNLFIFPIAVRPETATTPFVFRVKVIDLKGENVTEANVTARYGEFAVENITDSHGKTNLTLLDSYMEGSIWRVEAIKGELYAAAEVRVYSEDAFADLTLVVGRYSLTLKSDERNKDIMPDSNQSFIFNITNTGDLNDTYLISLAGLPEDWAVHFSG
ncbi:MAG: right-handed parallel beta-helix repeat-containing protein, partial [Thermoplasmata archaeon]|nr:right-handed parallel beta-helix repeat-containing protein [Thermoplasmata archaeon]